MGRDEGITVLSSVACLLISWTSLAWVITLTDRLGRGLGLSHGHSLAWDQLSGSTLGSAASKGAAGGREQQVLLLLLFLFLHCLLFHVSHTPTRSTSHRPTKKSPSWVIAVASTEVLRI